MPSESIQKKDNPNILFILVDELRMPSVFPAGIHDTAEFFKQYMPNIYKLWNQGVKFSNYHTAANACSPARGTIISGLYSQQTWVGCTNSQKPTTPPYTGPLGFDPTIAPTLNPAFPTYGKLLRTFGYRTPYIGKWHVSTLSNPHDSNQPDYQNCGLDQFGFNGYSYPDPFGFNLQGTLGYHHKPHVKKGDPVTPTYLSDEDTATSAIKWLNEEAEKSMQPWCLTVSFVNPHDKEFFWAGTEWETYNKLMTPIYGKDGVLLEHGPLYNNFGQGPGAPPVSESPNNGLNGELTDKEWGKYPIVPKNWESEKAVKDKSNTQYIERKISEVTWSGAADPNQNETEFTITEYPGFSEKTKLINGEYIRPIKIGMGPSSYWQRGLKVYTKIMNLVDQQIGRVLDAVEAMSDSEKENTVIVFASDHGEYAGAHGFLNGKIGSVYKEAFHIPLIVVDNRSGDSCLTGDIHIVRDGLVSSVDLMPMLVSIGNGGSNAWYSDKNSEYNPIYGNGLRHNIIDMLASGNAVGRDYVLLASDELFPKCFNTKNNQATWHILGLLTSRQSKFGYGKLGTYAFWDKDLTPLLPHDKEDGADQYQEEYYPYDVEGGIDEITNYAKDDKYKATVVKLRELLFNKIVPKELRAPLPETYANAEQTAKKSYQNWVNQTDKIDTFALLQEMNYDDEFVGDGHRLKDILKDKLKENLMENLKTSHSLGGNF